MVYRVALMRALVLVLLCVCGIEHASVFIISLSIYIYSCPIVFINLHSWYCT